MVPFFGLDLARELGSIDSRLTRVENDIVEVKRDIKAVDERVDKCLVAINRLADAQKADFRYLSDAVRSTRTLMAGLWVTVIGGFILQFFFK